MSLLSLLLSIAHLVGQILGVWRFGEDAMCTPLGVREVPRWTNCHIKVVVPVLVKGVTANLKQKTVVDQLWDTICMAQRAANREHCTLAHLMPSAGWAL